MKISAQVVILNRDHFVLGVSRKHDHNDFGLPGGKMEPEDEGDPERLQSGKCWRRLV